MQYGTGFGAMWFRKERRRFKEKESIDESQAKFYAYGTDDGAMWARLFLVKASEA